MGQASRRLGYWLGFIKKQDNSKKKKLVWVFKGVWVSVGQCGSVGVVGVFKGNPSAAILKR